MTIPTLSTAPAAPSRTTPSTFASLADAFIAWMSGFPTEMNAVIAAINAQGNPTTRAAVSANYTPVAGDNGKVFDCSAALTLNMTAAATLGAGWWCQVVNNSSGNVTIDPNASETIDGQTTGIVYPGFKMLVICDGTLFRAFKLDGARTEYLAPGTTTWTAPMGIRDVLATAQGAGASGRKDTSKGCGGGGGGCAIKRFVVTPGTAYTCAIGAGGAAVSANTTNGNAGGDTTLTVSATTITGGGGPGPTTGNAQGAVSAGGTATNGDLNIAGGYGVLMANASSGPSLGGDSQFGRGGVANVSGANAATGYGSGGAGATDNTHNSGAGMNGVLILEY